MYENSTFYAYYLLNNKNKNTLNLETLNTLQKKNLIIDDIIKLNTCNNNCIVYLS